MTSGVLARRRVAPWIAGAVAIVLLVVIVVAARAKPAEQRTADSPLLGHRAPAVAGAVISGPAQTLDYLRGKYVVVNFFATWCVPCRQEHPELVRFAAHHASLDDAAVMQVVYGDRASTVRSFLHKNGGDWTVVDDPKGSIALDWGVRGLPESYLVDPKGFVIYKITGGADDSGLEALLRQAKAGETR
ncbi:MAG: cytochrome c biosis protein CcmG, thiol:disulfide interchange protein DsbE [Actinomycetota bacterium]|jgi:cytochrome c biogenesis protein CcmG/thiol:disulfide interchange protein DsbE